MNRKVFSLLLALSPSAFGVDGQVLINHSATLAAGGYPYRITQPGSYKLSGNLTAPVNQMAIVVAASSVTVDLNGFHVSCSASESLPFSFSFGCISDGGAGLSRVTVRNGAVSVTATAPSFSFSNPVIGGINFFESKEIVAEDLKVTLSLTNYGGNAIYTGVNSIIRRNIMSGNGGGLNRICPSIVEGNVNVTGAFGGSGPAGCVTINNVGIF